MTASRLAASRDQRAGGTNGIHLLCLGISAYPQHETLTSAAVSAQRVFRRFRELAEDETLPLPLRTSELVVVPSNVERELMRELEPDAYLEFERAFHPGTRRELDAVLNAWFDRVRSSRDDVAVFYFAGHGLGLDEEPGEESKTLLLTADFDDNFQRPPRALDLGHLLSALQPASATDQVARSQLFLLDCCRDRGWSGPPAEQGELEVRIADRDRFDRRVRDDRAVAVHYACCAGGQTWSSDSDLTLKRLRTTNYCNALLDSLARLARLPELQVDQLARHVEVALREQYDQQTRRGRWHNFPLRVAGPDALAPANQVRLVRPGENADPRAATALEDAPPAGERARQRPQGLGRPTETVRPEAAPSPRRAPLVLAGFAGVTLAALAFVTSRSPSAIAPQTAVPTAAPNPSVRVRAPEPPPPAPRREDTSPMIHFPAARFTPGSSPKEAQTAHAACLAYGAAHGWTGTSLPATMPCQKPFTSSLFVRETWIHDSPRDVPAFELDRVEVTTASFVRWLNDRRTSFEVKENPAQGVPLVSLAGTGPIVALTPGQIRVEAGVYTSADGADDVPVTFVTHQGATEYCRAQGKRLPSELEWEWAARGAERREFPWGAAAPECDKVNYARLSGEECATPEKKLEPVGSSPLDHTPEGVADLGGSVSEWTSDEFVDPRGSEPQCRDERDPCRVIRGGGFSDHGVMLRAAIRGRMRGGLALANVGFRCAKGAE